MRNLIAATAVLMLTAAGAAAGWAVHSAPAPAARQPEAPPAAHPAPGLVWRSGTVTLRLTERACPFDDLSNRLQGEGVGPARAYVVQHGSRQATGCWAEDVGGDVITLEPGQELGQIPINWFRNERGA